MLEIITLGDWEFMFDALNAVARMTESRTMDLIAASVFIVSAVLWQTIKSMMEDKPGLQFKEMFFALFAWIILGSSISPKFDVAILSQGDPSVFAVVDDVPALIALPAWFSTQVLDAIGENLRDEFTPVSYTSGNSTTDPLQALVRLYNDPLPRQFSLGTNNGGGFDLQRSIRNYIQDCYILDHQLTGREPTSPISILRKSVIDDNIWQQVRVNFNGIGTTIFVSPDGSEFGEFFDCPTAHTQISNTLNNLFTDTMVQQILESKDIDPRAIADSIGLIQQSFGTGPSAAEITVGLFTAYMMRDGLRNTAFETDIDQMVFNATRQRLFQAAGESNVFERYSRPILSLLEAFSIFIYPIALVLLMIGTGGINHIGKYFMLTLFIGLWGIMKIYVDFFTIKTAEDAFEFAQNPLSFDGIIDTILQFEDTLTIAAQANAAIPAFAMFLIFGGIHGLQGAIRGLAGVSVNGNYGSPSISTPQDNLVRQSGDYNETLNSNTGNLVQGYKNINDTTLGNGAIVQQFQSSNDAAATFAQSELAGATSKFSDAYSNALSTSNSSSLATGTSTESSANYTRSLELANSISSAVDNVQGISTEEAQAFGLNALIGSGTNGPLALRATAEESLSNKSSETQSEAARVAQGVIDSYRDQEGYAELFKQVETGNTSFSDVIQSGNTELFEASQNYQNVAQSTQAISERISSSAGVAVSRELNLATANTLDLNTSDFYNNLQSQGVNSVAQRIVDAGGAQTTEEAVDLINQRLSNVGVSSGEDILDLAQNGNQANGFNGTDFGGLLALNSSLTSAAGETITDNAIDNLISASAFEYTADGFDNENSADANRFRDVATTYQNNGENLLQISSLADTENRITEASADIRASGQSASSNFGETSSINRAQIAAGQTNEEVEGRLNAANEGLTQAALSNRAQETLARQTQLSNDLKEQFSDQQNSAFIVDKLGAFKQFADQHNPDKDEQNVDYNNPASQLVVGDLIQKGSNAFGVATGVAQLFGTDAEKLNNATPGELAQLQAGIDYFSDSNNGFTENLAQTEAGRALLDDFNTRSDLVNGAIDRINEPGIQQLINTTASDIANGSISSSEADALIGIARGSQYDSVENFSDFNGDDQRSILQKAFSFTSGGAITNLARGNDISGATQQLTEQEISAANYLAQTRYSDLDAIRNNGNFSSVSDTQGQAARAAISARDSALLNPESTQVQAGYAGSEITNAERRANIIADSVYQLGQVQGGGFNGFNDYQTIGDQLGQNAETFKNFFTGGTGHELLKDGVSSGFNIIGDLTRDEQYSDVNGNLRYALNELSGSGEAGGYVSPEKQRIEDNARLQELNQFSQSNSNFGNYIRTDSGQEYKAVGTSNGNAIFRDGSGTNFSWNGDSFSKHLGNEVTPFKTTISEREASIDYLNNAAQLNGTIGDSTSLGKNIEALNGQTFSLAGTTGSSNEGTQRSVYQDTISGDRYEYDGYQFKEFYGDLNRQK